MEDICRVLERFNLKNSSKILRKEIGKNKTTAANDEFLLSALRKAMVNKEKKKMREETKGINLKYKPFKPQDDKSFNKEETEAIMEKLMNRIVANPKLINEDSELNQKIEKIFNLEAFQKMVENADIFQDLSSSSLFSNSQLLQKSMMSQNTGMNQLLQPASLASSSVIDQSQKIDFEILKKEQEDSLLKSDKEESMHSEHLATFTRNDQKAKKSRDEDHYKKKIPQLKEEKTHTVSHEENPPMKNKEIKGNKEESHKISDRISKELKDHLTEGSPKTAKDEVDEYENDEDPGFIIEEVKKSDLPIMCQKISLKYGFPE
jgi:hypothetical protein